MFLGSNRFATCTGHPYGFAVLRMRRYYEQATPYGVSDQAPQAELIARIEKCR
jgi:hypothetical protein